MTHPLPVLLEARETPEGFDVLALTESLEAVHAFIPHTAVMALQFDPADMDAATMLAHEPAPEVISVGQTLNLQVYAQFAAPLPDCAAVLSRLGFHRYAPKP
ncbi:hypothetical protein [Deinococcus sp. QL22]|uniref:hypothetical protein n=1 Tax=Deinococcus sp. QL22 TaxID=2939437 RepID=UPI0020182D8A|nr:hypothetical protein [Deinococcus sp. QL22]UQN04969.1 hypothetical protein M1R55_08585 [Deinococcus sp. QL22]